MNKAFFENSLGNETVDVLGFTTIEAFEDNELTNQFHIIHPHVVK